MSILRNPGLDIARSIAILMVLISHGRHFFNKYCNPQPLAIFGFMGVEIFFVLSGFLIGRIIIKDILENGTWKSLKIFYLRRWFRTLPAYFLVVTLLILIGNPFHWANLFFVQNFSESALNFFPVSWSLSIEEWFYLLTPLLLLVSTKIWVGHNKATFLSWCFFVIAGSLAARIIYVDIYNPVMDFGVRKQIFLRLDSLLIGVMIAGLKIYYSNFYKKITKFNVMLFILAVSGLIAYGIYYNIILNRGQLSDNSFFSRTALFTVFSIFAVILVIALETNQTINHKWAQGKFANIFKFVSITSYSVYLIHYDIMHYFNKINNQTNILFSIVSLIFALVITFSIAHFIYKYYEKPVTDMRDKF